RRPARPCAGPASSGAPLPPEAGSPADPDRAPVLGRRPELQPHLSRPSLGAAGARLGGAAPPDGGPRLLAAARPHQAALGAVAGPGYDPQALRADHEDAPRPG